HVGGFHHTALQAAAVSSHKHIVRYLLDTAGATFALVERRMARRVANFDAADKLLEKIRKEVQEGIMEDKADPEWKDTDFASRGRDEEEQKPPIMPLNIESIPGFQNPWKKASHWDVVRDLTVNSLRQRSVMAEAEQIKDIHADNTALGLLANA